MNVAHAIPEANASAKPARSVSHRWRHHGSADSEVVRSRTVAMIESKARSLPAVRSAALVDVDLARVSAAVAANRRRAEVDDQTSNPRTVKMLRAEDALAANAR